MIDVAHYSDNRRTRLGGAFLARQSLFQLLLNLFCALEHNAMTQLFHYEGRGILIQYLIDVSHDAEVHQLLDDLTRFNRHLLSEIADRDVLRHVDVVNNFFSRLRKAVLVYLIVQFSLAATTTTRDTGLRRLEFGK